MKKILVIFSSVLFFSSCSSYYSSNGEEKYMRAQNGPRLEIPAPLSGDNISGFYILPPQEKDPRVSIKPPQS